MTEIKLDWFLTLLCNMGSGIAHHFGFYASVVTPSNDQEEIKYNIFLVNTFSAHIETKSPFYYVMISHNN